MSGLPRLSLAVSVALVAVLRRTVVMALAAVRTVSVPVADRDAAAAVVAVVVGKLVAPGIAAEVVESDAAVVVAVVAAGTAAAKVQAPVFSMVLARAGATAEPE